MEALPIPGTYIIQNINGRNPRLYHIQGYPPYEDDHTDLDAFLDAHSEASDDTGSHADIQEEYPEHRPDDELFGEPEKILAECWVHDEGNEGLDLYGHWFLVKYHGYGLVRSRWRPILPYEDDEEVYLFRGESIREKWKEEKERLLKGESKPFDLERYYGLLIEKSKIKRQRAGLRRLRKILESIKGALEAEKLDAEDYQEAHIETETEAS